MKTQALRKVVQGQRRLAVQQRTILVLMQKQLLAAQSSAGKQSSDGLSGLLVGHS